MKQYNIWFRLLQLGVILVKARDGFIYCFWLFVKVLIYLDCKIFSIVNIFFSVYKIFVLVKLAFVIFFVCQVEFVFTCLLGLMGILYCFIFNIFYIFFVCEQIIFIKIWLKLFVLLLVVFYLFFLYFLDEWYFLHTLFLYFIVFTNSNCMSWL